MPKIDHWLEQYKEFWQAKDVDGIMSLFTPDVVYGSHFKLHSSFKSISEEWQSIKKQQDIFLNFEVFARDGDRYAIIWELKYRKADNSTVHLRGTYLIKLDNGGKCTYFIHSGE